MLTINWKQIYEVSLNETKQWVLILYDISQNHYVGIPVYNENKDNSVYIKSINKYVVLSETEDYNRTNIKRCIYIKGKPLKITNKEFDEILKIIKKYYAFEEIKITNKSKIETTKRQTITQSKSKENREKVLT